MIRQNLTIKGSGDQNKTNLCKHHYEVTLTELILNMVQCHPRNLDCGVQIIRGCYKSAFQQAPKLQYRCLAL